MEPTDILLDQLSRDDIRQARNAAPSQKLRAGGDLFDSSCRWMMSGIYRDFPGANKAFAMKELQRRLDIAKVLEDRI